MEIFILVVILAVTCKTNAQLDLTESNTLSKVNGVNGVSGDTVNPYSGVGLCREDILSKRVADFNIDEISNTGKYNIIYISTGKFFCASAEIKGDSKAGYNGSATYMADSKAKTTTKVSYSLKVNSTLGVIEETFNGVDAFNKPFTRTFYLIVIFWDKEDGTFEYVRCSDKGTNTLDNRSIAVKAKCNTEPDSPGMVAAKTLYKYEYLFHLKGCLDKIKTCPV